MRAKINRIHVTTPILWAVLALNISWAAMAPKGNEKLKNLASHIISAKVIDVSTKIKKSEVETYSGIHRDTIFTITILTKGVSKGNKIKVGDKIKVVTWKPHTRKPNLPGLQGIDSRIPKKGDLVNFHLKDSGFYLKKRIAKTYVPILPNGIAIKTQKN